MPRPVLSVPRVEMDILGILSHSGQVTPRDICKASRGRVKEGTVYATLSRMVRLGFVKRIRVKAGRKQTYSYELQPKGVKLREIVETGIRLMKKPSRPKAASASPQASTPVAIVSPGYAEAVGKP